MDAMSVIEPLEPDVIQTVLCEMKKSGLSFNDLLRSLLPVKETSAPTTTPVSKYKGTRFVTSPTGVVVEVGCVTKEQLEEARAILDIDALAQEDPEELTRRGRENWAREHGY